MSEREFAFSMEIIKALRGPMEGQISEATLIINEKQRGTWLLNDTEEYNRCVIPTLTVIQERKPLENMTLL